jgi:DNA-binding SARP family transcriptional activator
MLEIKLFGAMSVTTPNGTVTASELGGVKPRQILEILAISPGIPVPKHQLADLLWDGCPPRSYVSTLESYLCALRRKLGLERGRVSAIRTTNHGYVLDPAAATTDLHEFRALLQAAESADPRSALGLLESAVDLATWELLAGEPYARWASQERAVAQSELVGAATLAARHATSLGEPAVAVRMARMAVSVDVLAEEAWRLLMRAFWLSGRRSEALRAYSELRNTLGDELGADPAVETQALYLEILRDEPVPSSGPQSSGRDEVLMLMTLLRQAVESVPGLQVPRTDRALAEIAASLGQVA